MGRGIVGPAAAGTRRLSEHFGAHFAGTTPKLRDFAAKLIDGIPVTLAPPLDVIPGPINTNLAQFAIVDTSSDADRVLIVTLVARTTAELGASPIKGDLRGTPVLIKDLHNGPAWDIYNCRIADFQVWRKQSIYYDNDWPAA
ncbi:MAG: hypothetical protein IPL41_06385 [Micropruina sp.]|uniref:hypothetical protein n=1 Tax=Micropruina sonneratiae TaxID=2986940 RepID=UPI0022266BB1|nr:hypothetical protein [Micropruina sp. KQZ13P-5]MBK8446311.1 hypothetical protein [Micropruina sp.]MCW3158633.1 hypothetical protein [Micropruina sp. KQZ13P-5]